MHDGLADMLGQDTETVGLVSRMFASPGAASIGDAQAMLAAYHTAWGVQNLSSTATSLSRTITEHGSDAALLHSLSVQESPAQELESDRITAMFSIPDCFSA